jgi:hypothetical protein
MCGILDIRISYQGETLMVRLTSSLSKLFGRSAPSAQKRANDEPEYFGFVITTAQGRAVVMDDVTGEEMTAAFKKAADAAVQSVRERHGMDACDM